MSLNSPNCGLCTNSTFTKLNWKTEPWGGAYNNCGKGNEAQASLTHLFCVCSRSKEFFLSASNFLSMWCHDESFLLSRWWFSVLINGIFHHMLKPQYICLSFSLWLVASSLEAAPPLSHNYAIHHGCVNKFHTSWQNFVFFLDWDCSLRVEKAICLFKTNLGFFHLNLWIHVFHITYTIQYISYILGVWVHVLYMLY